MPASPRWPNASTWRPRTSRARWRSPRARRSTSSWSGPRCRWPRAWPTAFAEAGIKVFGPSAKAAQLESSKGFTKELCRRHNIPTGAYERFTDLDKAVSYIKAQGAPIVVKADGLAAGKGVVVAETVEQAIEAARDMLSGNRFGAAGASVVIEEFLVGEEASFFALCDGEHALPLVGAQDHKRAFDGDKGPNTGGMGAYSPAPIFDAAMQKRTMDEIILPTVRAMAEAGTPFKGVLYAGLMIGAARPEDLRIQLPLRRSRVPGADDAAQVRHRAGADRLGRRRPEALRPALVERHGADRGDGGQGLSRCLPEGQRDPRPRRGGQGRGRADLPCRHETPTASACWPMAAGC